MSNIEERCPVCNCLLDNPDLSKRISSERFEVQYDCPGCGCFKALPMFNLRNEFSENELLLVSHRLMIMQKDNKSVFVDFELCKDIIKNYSLPKPLEQFDNFLLLLGEKSQSLGEIVELNTLMLNRSFSLSFPIRSKAQ